MWGRRVVSTTSRSDMTISSFWSPVLTTRGEDSMYISRNCVNFSISFQSLPLPSLNAYRFRSDHYWLSASKLLCPPSFYHCLRFSPTDAPEKYSIIAAFALVVYDYGLFLTRDKCWDILADTVLVALTFDTEARSTLTDRRNNFLISCSRSNMYGTVVGLSERHFSFLNVFLVIR